MNDLLAQLLDAHVEYELDRLRDGAWRQTIETEVNAAFDWMQTVRLGDIITPEQVLWTIRRCVVEYPVPDDTPGLIAETGRHLLAADANKKTVLKDIFCREQFDDVVDKVAGRKEARDLLIRRMVTGPAYAALISDVLYNGIKAYLLAENIITQKVPGVSSLIKLGKYAVNKTMRPIEAMVEARIKKFIESNIDGSLRRSEKTLSAYFNETRITDAADRIWRTVAGTPLSRYLSPINAIELKDFIAVGHDVFLHFRKTPYFTAVCTDLVYFLFEKYGDRQLDVLLADVGISRELVIEEISESASVGIEKALSTGYLETRIRERFAAFYGSKKAGSVVKAKKPAKPRQKKPKAG